MAHDAGAARHLFSWLTPLHRQLRFCVSGPALSILRSERPKATVFGDLETCLKGVQLVITGTGWSSDLEHQARSLAAQLEVPSIAVLDHWVNYPDRFERNNETVLPDTFWVADAEAESLAQQFWPTLPVLQLQNQWLTNLAKKVNQARERNIDAGPKQPASRLLYLLEPMRDRTTGKPNGGEIFALNYWINKIPKMIEMGLICNNKERLQIILRPHPAEPEGKYDSWRNEYNNKWNITIDNSIELADALSTADLAFGYETQALIASLSCGIKSISTAPPDGAPCRLPHCRLLELKRIC